jgi:hypothetical protein
MGRATCCRSGSARATRSRRNSSGRRRSPRCSAARPSMRHNLGLPELREAIARYMAALHPADRRPHCRDLGRRQRADAGGAGAGGCGRRSRRGHAGLAEPDGPARDPGRAGALRVAAAAGRRLDSWTWMPCSRPSPPATRLLIVNAPNNPTGWTLTRDEQRRSWRIAAPPAPGSWPTRSTSACITMTPRMLRAELPGRGAPDDRLVVVHSFSKSFPDDRLASGLAGAAAGADAADRQADRIQYLVRAGVRAARGGRPRWRAPTRSRRAWSRT